jgi:hypothetical protein
MGGYPDLYNHSFGNMKRYQLEISAINSAIASFNTHMAAEFRVPEFDMDAAVPQNNIVEILHGRWDDFPFPNAGARGVYFIFGHEKVLTEKNGLYIGKASFGSTTGNRLYAWLHPHRSKEHFIMNYGQETYILDYMASIDLDRLRIPFMASALEEYLISSLRSSINLMNGTGN